jgi:hypothetical protein
MTQFIAGMMVAGDLVAALFFLRFWRQSRDRLFGFFAAAFLLLAAQRTALALLAGAVTDPLPFYVVRALAFILILVAIIDKNRRGGRAGLT